jgi:tetratricopeptide (TPR) repeat protein
MLSSLPPTGTITRSILLLGIVVLTAIIYWPVWHAGFVWVDKICFYDNAWLRQGDAWKHFIFRNFYDWTNYFRPLVVAMFVAEVRGFDVAPGPMHLVSLGLHLANTLLVALLARKLLENAGNTNRSTVITALATLFYALHPALIEPVVWISCQFELAVNFFVLLGLLANLAIRHTALRAATAAACFFLAACAKESAVVFPLLLILIDWMRAEPGNGTAGLYQGMKAQLRRQWFVYIAILAAGLAYLALRHWALGFLVNGGGHESVFSLAHLQTVAYTYLAYWRILVWPMQGLGPLHVVDTHAFAHLGAKSMAIDGAAAFIALGAAYLALKRRPVGILAAAFTLALLPVLHIVPIEFDESLYHERYAMTAIAMACALLPLTFATLPRVILKNRTALVMAGSVAAIWLGAAIVNIRVTLPLWTDEAKLWLWVLRDNPHSIGAMNHLLTTYIERNDRPQARAIGDLMLKEKPPCPMCMINIAHMAFADGDAARAATALNEAARTVDRVHNKRLTQSFVLASGELYEMQGDAKGAEEAYRDAIVLEPMDPDARLNLALLLARQRRTPEALQVFAQTLPLLAPDERPAAQRFFEQTLAHAATAPPAPDEPSTRR